MKIPQHPILPWLSLALLAYLSGDLMSAALERQFQGRSPRVNATASTTTAALNGLKQPEDLRAVLTNRSLEEAVSGAINGTTTRPGGTGAPPPVAGNATVPLPKLAGTMEGQGQALAVLQSGQETQVVAVGEEWMGYKVMEVSSFEARLRNAQGQEFTIAMAMAGEQGPPQTPGTMAQPAVNSTNTSPGNSTEGAGETGPYHSVRELRADIDQRAFVKNILVQPVQRGEDVIGIRVNYSNPANPFARLGMQSGDIIQTFNGRAVKGMQDMDWALKELRNSTSLNFEVERNGQTVPLNVQLEP